MTPPFLLLCSTSTCESCVSYMTPFPTPYSTSICGFCVSSRLPPFSAFRRRSYTRFSNSPRNNTAWYSSFVSSPIGALLRCSGYFFGDAILRCFFFVRLSCVAQALSAWSWVFMCSRVCLLYFVYWLHTVVSLR